MTSNQTKYGGPNPAKTRHVRLQHFDNAASLRIYSRVSEDGPSNVVLRMPRQTIFFALFWLHPIHWEGGYLSIITAVMAIYHSTRIKKYLVILQLCRISGKNGERLSQCYSTTNLSCSSTVIPIIVVRVTLQRLFWSLLVTPKRLNKQPNTSWQTAVYSPKKDQRCFKNLPSPK